MTDAQIPGGYITTEHIRSDGKRRWIRVWCDVCEARALSGLGYCSGCQDKGFVDVRVEPSRKAPSESEK